MCVFVSLFVYFAVYFALCQISWYRRHTALQTAFQWLECFSNMLPIWILLLIVACLPYLCSNKLSAPQCEHNNEKHNSQVYFQEVWRVVVITWSNPYLYMLQRKVGVCMCVCTEDTVCVPTLYSDYSPPSQLFFLCNIRWSLCLHFFFSILGICEAKLSVSNLWAQPAQRQMFGADVPAASNNTTLQQLSTQAGRRQYRIGRAGGWETDTRVDVDIIA